MLQLTGEHDIGRLPEGNFDATLVGIRGLVNISPDLNLSSFAQYDTESRTAGSNTRLRWTFKPAGDLFVVYNHNLVDYRHSLMGPNHNLDDSSSTWRLESNQLLVKVQYAFWY